MAKQRPADHGATAQAGSDAQTFREAVRDVRPLAQKAASAAAAQGLAKPKPRAGRRPIAAAVAEDLGAAMPAADPGMGAAALSFQRAGVRTQVVRRLRRGLYPIEDELDLHGLTQTAARDLLERFIARNREAGSRCVRIIHGKGYRSGARGPVLKSAVNLWLRRHLDVMAFTSARPIDGGTGAVYVLLRG
jgi:DNA-nicking Smr family endonuclease